MKIYYLKFQKGGRFLIFTREAGEAEATPTPGEYSLLGTLDHLVKDKKSLVAISWLPGTESHPHVVVRGWYKYQVLGALISVRIYFGVHYL